MLNGKKMTGLPLHKQTAIIVAVSLISGAASFAFLTLVNHVIAILLNGGKSVHDPKYILLFLFTILVFILSRRFLSVRIISMSQRIFWDSRKSVLASVLKSNYAVVNGKKVEIQSALQHDVNTITQASLNVIHFVTSVVFVIACLVYMFIVSVPLFLISMAAVLAGIGLYFYNAGKNKKRLEETRDLENRFLYYFNSMLSGFKEIQINPDIGKEINDEKVMAISSAAYEKNTRTYTGLINNQIVGQFLFYVLIASILLYFAGLFKLPVSTTVSFTFILLFLLGSLEAVLVLLPGLMQASVSYNRIITLKKELNQSAVEEKSEQDKILFNDFTSINLNQLSYQYQSEGSTGDKNFKIGPISLDINKGEVIFIYGGNGSGKTTFIHSLLGLLPVSENTIWFNETLLGKENRTTYKSLFSAVFNDFYLFDEFYANKGFNIDKANEYLRVFEIGDKVEINTRGFSSTNLSTGQRKRLGLVDALLRERPIIVLDEWAADQDPNFRKKFYKEIIPMLKSQGFTVLAITHDDAYYHCADKIYKMDFGRLSNETLLYKEQNLHFPLATQHQN